ncbi:MAG TPA: QueT transporter family protein, partial [Coriobacteriia bacterium]|nr:QueT transporter family protein [Coriobacteriia bacterium]
MTPTATRKTRLLAQAGVIAAVHAAATVAVLQMPAQLGWGPVQLRLSEALTVVALFTPAAVPGLALGTALGNASMVAQVGAVGLLDVIAGSLATLLGAWWTWRFRAHTALALAGPVVSNALIVPIYLPVLLAAAGLGNVPLFGVDPRDGWLIVYAAGVLTVGVGQALVVYG